jgi:tetratricopeptide (TPR) repeat protein
MSPPVAPGAGPSESQSVLAELPPDDGLPRFLANAVTHKERDSSAKMQLASAVRYQLMRAQKLYARGENETAAQLVYGSLLLLRQDDAIDAALADAGPTLLQTAHEAARRGDSGRAFGLYQLAEPRLAPSQIQDVRGHLQALKAFEGALESKDSLVRSGEQARSFLHAALVDPSKAAYTRGQDQVLSWIKESIADDSFNSPDDAPLAREKALEAFRAQRGGAPALISLALRQGEPKSALRALASVGLEDAVPRALERVINRASEGSSERYVELYHMLDAARRAEDGEVGLPRALLDAAVFWSALLAAQNGEGEMDDLLPLAVSLVEFEMGDVAAHLLGRTATENLSRQGLEFCLSLGLRAILDQGAAFEVEAAERTFQELRPLLELAQAPAFARIEPSPATLGRALAEAELVTGRLDSAVPRLEAAFDSAPTPEGGVRFATVLNKVGQTERALKVLERSLALAQASGDLFLESVAETEIYKTYRQLGQRELGRSHLDRALARILTARSLELSVLSRSALERQLALVLEYYGDSAGKRRAYARAIDASRNIPSELKRTLTDMARSALVERDLPLAREATHHALELELPDEDGIYIALWQALLEGELAVASDGMPQELLQAAGDVRGWPYHLRQWGLGKLGPSEILLFAQGEMERAEARFYVGMRERGALREKALKEVSASRTVSLVEASIAEALLRGDAKEPLPAGVIIP